MELDNYTRMQKEKEYQDIIDSLVTKGISPRNARRLVDKQSKKTILKFKKEVFKSRNKEKQLVELSPEELIDTEQNL